MENRLPSNQVYWMKDADKITHCPALNKDIEAEVVIIGGGTGGLICAYELSQRNIPAVILEKEICGAGASGMSGGFLVSIPEVDLQVLITQYGQSEARKIIEFGSLGVNLITQIARQEKIECNLKKSDSLYLANKENRLDRIAKEVTRRVELGFPARFLTQEELGDYIGSDQYAGGALFEGTYNMDPFNFCIGVRNILLKRENVTIYEDTEVKQVIGDHIKTQNGIIEAKKVIFCSDRFVPNYINKDLKLPYINTSILMSKQLDVDIQRKIFPNEHTTQAWDEFDVYNYLKLTADGRLLCGGGDYFSTYTGSRLVSPENIYWKLMNYLKEKFPFNITSDWYWRGEMGAVDDLLPMIGQSNVYHNHLFNVATTGLSMAAAGGYALTKLITSDGDKNIIPRCFTPNRQLLSNGRFGDIVGRQLPCAISHAQLSRQG